MSLLSQAKKKYHINLYYSPLVASGANTRVSGLLESSQIDKEIVFIRYEQKKMDSHYPNEVILKSYLNQSSIMRVLVTLMLQLYLRNKVCVIDTFPMLPFKNHYLMIHDVGNYIPGLRRSRWLRAFFFNLHLKTVKNVVTVSNYSANMLRKLAYQKNIVVSYNAISQSMDALARNDNYEKGQRVIDFLFVTSGEHHKRDFEVLCFLSEFYPNFKISVAGRYNGFADSLLCNENITIHNEPNDEKLASLYRSAKVYISYSRHEGYGITVLEALSFGCNCVITKIPVFVELYKSYPCVYFIPIHDAAASKHIFDEALRQPTTSFLDSINKTYNWNNIYNSLRLDLEIHEK